MIKTTISSTLLVTSLFFSACSQDKQEQTNSSANSIIAKNQYVLTGLDDKQYVVQKESSGFKLQNAEGKVVIFDLFATWCQPCRATVPHLAALQKKYKDDLIVIGVTIEDALPNQKLQDFRETYGANYILVNSAQNRVLVNAIARSFQLRNNFPIPIMAIYKDGELVNHYLGLVEQEFVENDIKKALGK